MNTSLSPVRIPVGSTHNAVKLKASKAADCESMAKLLEEFIPKFKHEHERQFYQEVVDAYRTAARDFLRQAWSDDKGQDIAEYAVMLAVILVLVVGYHTTGWLQRQHSVLASCQFDSVIRHDTQSWTARTLSD